MILVWIILIPLIGGVIAWIAGNRNAILARWIALASLIAVFLLVIMLWFNASGTIEFTRGNWLAEINKPWIPQLGISLHFAVDGLSIILLALTAFLGIISVICSWTEIRERVGFFHFNLLWILTGILGVFLALDLFLFYFFWELMLIPMYFLIRIWGHENRVYASYKFFIFTQAGGLLMFLSILALYVIHGKDTGLYTFDYTLLMGTAMSPAAAMWIMLGFCIAFIVKLPAVPFHTWLPDAHTEAPTAGSVILAGLLLKTGAYGLLRFALPLFSEAAAELAPIAMIIAVIGIIYGALLAFGQSDLKRLIAYTSVSHMGFVMLGIFAGTTASLSGAVMQMAAHGITTGALFIIVGMVQERIHTRNLEEMGGLWSLTPRLGAVGLVFALASLGLPGSGNFVGEFLVLLGTYQSNIAITVMAATGLVLAAIYSLWIVQHVFHGEKRADLKLADLSMRETGMMAVMIFIIFWLGMYPRLILITVGPVMQALQCCARP